MSRTSISFYFSLKLLFTVLCNLLLYLLNCSELHNAHSYGPMASIARIHICPRISTKWEKQKLLWFYLTQFLLTEFLEFTKKLQTFSMKTRIDASGNMSIFCCCCCCNCSNYDATEQKILVKIATVSPKIEFRYCF